MLVETRCGLYVNPYLYYVKRWMEKMDINY